MKALRFPSRDTVEIAELADPVAGPGEVVVAVRASGICHTDIEVMHGNYGTSAFPIVPGHEYAGEIVDIGPGVTGLSVGDRVVVDPNIECGRCRACRRGWAHLCDNLGAYGVTVNGGFADLSVVRAGAVHPVGETSFAAAALAEPMGCVLNGLSPLRDRLIERAVVFGTGPMGLLLGLALSSQGTEEVVMVDLDQDRLAMAEEHGLKPIHARSERLATLRHACDLSVDATGIPAVARSLTEYAANGGSALYFGVCPSDARIEISPFEVFRRQLSIFGTHSLNHNIPEALATLAAIGPGVEEVVTHRLPLDDIAAILGGQPRKGSMKVQFSA